MIAIGPLWGYCASCERWRCSDRWQAAGSGPSCPECGRPPALLERVENGKAKLALDLEVAVGPVGDRTFFPE